MVLNCRPFCPPPLRFLLVSEEIFDDHDRGRGATGAKDAAKYLTMHKTALMTRNYPVQNSAETEKHGYLSWVYLSYREGENNLGSPWSLPSHRPLYELWESKQVPFSSKRMCFYHKNIPSTIIFNQSGRKAPSPMENKEANLGY